MKSIFFTSKAYFVILDLNFYILFFLILDNIFDLLLLQYEVFLTLLVSK